MKPKLINSMLLKELDTIVWDDVLGISREVSPKWFILRLNYLNGNTTDYIYLDETHRNDDYKLVLKYIGVG